MVTRRNGALNETALPSIVNSVVPFTATATRSSIRSVNSIIQR